MTSSTSIQTFTVYIWMGNKLDP